MVQQGNQRIQLRAEYLRLIAAVLGERGEALLPARRLVQLRSHCDRPRPEQGSQSILHPHDIVRQMPMSPHGRSERGELTRTLEHCSLNRTAPELFRQTPRVLCIALVACRLVWDRHYHLVHERAHCLVQPGAVRPLLEDKVLPTRNGLEKRDQREAGGLHNLQLQALPPQ